MTDPKVLFGVTNDARQRFCAAHAADGAVTFAFEDADGQSVGARLPAIQSVALALAILAVNADTLAAEAARLVDEQTAMEIAACLLARTALRGALESMPVVGEA